MPAGNPVPNIYDWLLRRWCYRAEHGLLRVWDRAGGLFSRGQPGRSAADGRILAAVLSWLRDDWAIERPVFLTNEHLDHQIATIESLGLARRFDYDRDTDMYTSHAYA